MSSTSSEVKVERPIHAASVTAGVGLLLMSVLAGFGKFVAVDGLVTPGDAARTARDITESAGLFRLGIASLFLVIALDVVVAWGLYRVFSPVNRNLSMVAAAFRLVYSGVFLVAIGQLFGPLRLFAGDAYLGVFDADQLNAQALLEITAFADLWMMSLGLFGIHLLVLGYLAYRSGYVPRVLGVLLAVAGLGYVIDTFGVLFSPNGWTDVSTYTFLGEFLLALWLVIQGRRVTSTGSSN
ncbi:DUF4386 domain-containing protein [Amycolatopsis pittospori]|uniref:DUF4386 domain-containing protein n=1 Tax=Amycolatopsis pittospori TaxID=2749434 RepID=UPI0015F0A1B9|nr:DUF4386 domain-containing protein [Amycolatopsis pittospori]